MPKAKWGSGDKALTAADIDGAERGEVKARYSGEVPPGGMYRFILQRIKQEESKNGNPMIQNFLTIDGSWKPNHKQYDGAPLWDRIPVIPSTKERLANFLDAIGAEGADLMERSIVDENGYITKLGGLGDPAGILVYVNVKHTPAANGYQAKLETYFTSYLPVTDGADGAITEGADEDGEEPPF